MPNTSIATIYAVDESGQQITGWATSSQGCFKAIVGPVQCMTLPPLYSEREKGTLQSDTSTFIYIRFNRSEKDGIYFKNTSIFRT
jgi:uncharacterized membrane protein